MSTLEIDSVQLSFNGRRILSNIYLKCESGDVIGVMGRNGSGKSSLLKIIFGNLNAENASLRYNGNYTDKIYKIPGAIYFVPQEGMLMNYLTFNDIVRIFKLESKLDQIGDLAELGVNPTSKIGNLSGGIKKFIEIITMLYAESSFALLDEPFSYLSPVLVEKLTPHIVCQSRSKGIIITDHQYQTVWSTANKYYMLYDGGLKEIFEQEQLEAYGYL